MSCVVVGPDKGSRSTEDSGVVMEAEKSWNNLARDLLGIGKISLGESE